MPKKSKPIPVVLDVDQKPCGPGLFFKDKAGRTFVMEPEYFDLQTKESIRECIARTVWSTANGEMPTNIASLVISACKAAAATMKDEVGVSETASILHRLAKEKGVQVQEYRAGVAHPLPGETH